MEGKEGRKKGARKRFCDGTCDSSRLFKVLPYLSCAAALFGVSASMALRTPMEAKLANQRWDGLSFPQAEAPKLRSRPTRNCPCLLFGNLGSSANDGTIQLRNTTTTPKRPPKQRTIPRLFTYRHYGGQILVLPHNILPQVSPTPASG